MPYLTHISEFPVGNAAGWCKSVKEVRNLAPSVAQFIVFGSITLQERAGNPGNTFNGSSLNSLGLPNPGLKKVLEMAPDILRIAHDEGKTITLSVAGFSPRDYETLSTAAQDAGFDGVELNLGCPNVVDGGARKPIASFDLTLIEEIVGTACAAVDASHSGSSVSVKMSPMSNPLQIIDTAQLLARYSISVVVTQNTFPNALLFNDNGTPQIQTPDGTGWAGHAGSEVKAQALGQVSQWRNALDLCGGEHIEVCGVGGVQSGRDVRDMLLAGAALMQVGTAYFAGGPRTFGVIADQFINLP